MAISQKDWALLGARLEGLSAGATKLLIAMEAIRNRSTGWINATIDGLAARVGCCRASLFRFRNELVAAGRLIVVQQWSETGQRACRYRFADLTPAKVAEAAEARQQRRLAAYRANTVKRQQCLRAWSDRLERYVWGRVASYMGGAAMGLNSEIPLPSPAGLTETPEAATAAYRGVHLTIWQQRSKPTGKTVGNHGSLHR